MIADPKEPHFLAHAGQVPSYAGPGDDFLINDRIVADPSQYSKLFAASKSGILRGEGSVSTLAYPDPSIANIKAHCPADVKLIACLREPVERMFSSYLYLRSRERETHLRFEDALADEQRRISENWHHMWRYRALSQYHTLLEPFIHAFGRDQVHIVISERLTGVDSAEFAGVASFLGLNEVDRSIEFGHINGGGVAGKSLLSRATSQVIRNEKLLEAAKAVVPRSVQERVYDRVFSRPQIEESLRHELQQEFVPVTEYVEGLIGPLPEWMA